MAVDSIYSRFGISHSIDIDILQPESSVLILIPPDEIMGRRLWGRNIFDNVLQRLGGRVAQDIIGGRREGEFPWLLLVICFATEFLRVHAKLTRHLDVRMGKVEALPRIDPRLIFGRQILLPLCHNDLSST